MSTLEEAQIGDKVLILRTLQKTRLGVVTKVTPTQITVGENKYVKRTGREVGSSGWDRRWVLAATAEQIQKVSDDREHDALVEKIAAGLANQSLNTLRCINTQMKYKA